MPVEDISNSLEDLRFSAVRQITATQRAPNGQTHTETLPLFLVTLIRNIKSQAIYKLNNLKHIIIKPAIHSATTAKIWSCLGQLQASPLMCVV
jgi:hypothetical protein